MLMQQVFDLFLKINILDRSPSNGSKPNFKIATLPANFILKQTTSKSNLIIKPSNHSRSSVKNPSLSNSSSKAQFVATNNTANIPGNNYLSNNTNLSTNKLFNKNTAQSMYK